jgi:hypothetical protein
MEQKGKVLRFKSGYNPNSSSVGSQIPSFFFFAIGSGVCAIIAMQVLNMIGIHIRKKKDSIQSEKQE